MAKLTEKQFLINFGLKYFNNQYTKNVRVDECDIVSIPARFSFERSYEITTNRLDDNVCLHIHIRFEGADGLSQYRLELDSDRTQITGNSGSLSDEVYVATGSIDPYYLTSGTYKFRYIGEDPTLQTFLLQENGFPLLFEDGTPIQLEEA